MTKHLLIASAALIAVSVSTSHAGTPKRPEYTKDDEARVDALIKTLSLEEKVRQLNSVLPGKGAEVMTSSRLPDREALLKIFGKDNLGVISMPLNESPAKEGSAGALTIQEVATKTTRNGVPTFIASEALHGLNALETAVFPQSIALGATWDVALMQRVADRIGRESHARGATMLHSPVLDLGRDPRHGRFEECYSEDVLLASRMGVAYVRGVQAHDVVCTAKHFVANFVGPGGRDSGDIEISDREMKEIHFAPYEAAVREGGLLGIMTAYNSVNGLPCSANHHLLRDILREEWGFKGVVVSDWSAAPHSRNNLRIAPDLEGSARACLTAGLDFDLPRNDCYKRLAKEIAEGRLDIQVLDAAVRRVLLTKAAIGLLAPGAKFADPDEAVRLSRDEERRALPLEAAREAIVLLKNKDNVLPLAASAKSIAVIGPNAVRWVKAGYSAKDAKGPSPVDAIRARFGKSAEILSAKGCDLTGEAKDDDARIAEAVETARKADLSILVVGGQYGLTGGESQDRATLDLMGRQEELIRAVAAVGKPVVVVLSNGYPVTVANWIDRVDGLLCAWNGGSEDNIALAEVLAGDVNPSGHLPVTFPRSIAQVPMTYDMRPHGRPGKYAVLNPGKAWEAQGALRGNRYDPQYPFGFGLSYTTFQYTDLTLSAAKVPVNGRIKVSVKVTNTGAREGSTVAQLYLAADWQRIVPRERSLRDWSRVSLKPGESRVVSFELGAKDFSFLDESLKRVVEPGAFTVTVGDSCLAPLAAKLAVTAR